MFKNKPDKIYNEIEDKMVGSIVLSFALLCSLLAMVMYFLNYKGYKNTLNYGRIAYHAMAMLVIVAAALLWHAILTHSYEYKYVYDYSSSDLPLGFLISTFWGGQEGSFMLWLLLSSIIGIVLQSYSSKRGDLEPRVMAVFTLATTFLLVMVSPMFKNPFTYIWSDPMFIDIKNVNASLLSMPFLQNFIYSDGQTNQQFVKMTSDLYASLTSAGISVNQFIINGKGLNPQLLNFWMQIHPPILFTGFSMSTVPFAFAMAAMMKNDYRDWVKQSFPWVLAGAGILGLGIMLGGYWAYEMLGWGGYWAWDPVENSSLIPWIIGVASVHTLLVQRKSQNKGGTGKFAKTNLILCMLTYILVLYATFLTRSGVLGDASVHSFVDPGMLVYLFLVIFIGVFIVLGFGMLAYRWKYLSENIQTEESLLSRELALFTAAVVLCASAIIVFVGTSAPLISSAVETSFYNQMELPIVIIIGLLNGLSLLIKWKHSEGQELFKKSIPAGIATLVFSGVVIIFAGITNLMVILMIFATAFSLFVNLEIAIKIIRGNLKMLGAYVAHIGIAIFILGIIGSAVYSQEKDIDLVKGKTEQALGYDMTFTGWKPIDGGKKYAFNINVNKNGKKYAISPVMYISDYNNSLMREPAIRVGMTHDLYISPVGYDEGNQEAGTTVTLGVGESIDYKGTKITYTNFDQPDLTKMTSGQAISMGTKLTIEKDGKKYNIEPKIEGSMGNFSYVADQIKDANIKIQIKKVDPQSQKTDFIVEQLVKDTPEKVPQEVLSIQASIKPFISLVWIGIVIMVVGFFVSVGRRLKESFI
ncbi:MAG TPA: cytochrome c-type biogenesis CcmF C-terminal domain-containing protein [Ignavibacteriaceae bacterium]|nr:cytochrome c-type biogenesis CcmF C-terminal domain-containing protein [Ignavibacteriaceae bacterium]